MAKRALSWKRAGAIGWRDLRSAPAKFGFVVVSVAVGVAALVGVRGFSNSFRRTLSTEARALMAGDLSARLFHEPTAEEMGKIAAIAQPAGIRTTWVTETVSMASVPPDPVPVLVSLKAVDPGEYPYYGEVELEPVMSLQQALDGDSAVVAEEFLIRLNARVGQTLRLGGRDFRISAVLKQEPDRISAGAGLGPRVMISQAALQRTGLISPGSRASQRLLLKLPPQSDAPAHLAALRKQVEAALPDAQVMDFHEGNPGLNKGLDNATAILSLICLVAMVLGAIGVAIDAQVQSVASANQCQGVNALVDVVDKSGRCAATDAAIGRPGKTDVGKIVCGRVLIGIGKANQLRGIRSIGRGLSGEKVFARIAEHRLIQGLR